MKKIKVAVLVSGGGTNLGALIEAEKKGIIKSGEISLVISNKANAYALERAKNAGIEAMCLQGLWLYSLRNSHANFKTGS